MRNKRDIKNFVIYVAVMITIGMLPAPEPITPLGMRIIGIMTGTIWAWCTLDMIWPSFIALILVGVAGYSSVTELFASAMSNTTLMQMFFLLLFGGIITESGVGHALAIRIVNLKFASGKPWLLSFLIIMAAFIPGLIVGSTPAMIVVWSIIYSVCDEVGMKKRESWPVFILFMTAVESIRAMNVFPFQISVVAVLGFAQAVDPGVTIPYAPWIVFTLIYILLELLALMLVFRFVFKPDVSRLKKYKQEKHIDPFTVEQRWALRLLGVMVVLLMIPNMLPEGNLLVDTLSRIGTVGIIALVVSASLLISKDGKQMFPFNNIANKGLIWAMMVMSTSALTVSNAMTSEEAGVAVFLNNFVSGMTWIKGGSVFGFALLAVALIVTNVLANNIVGLITITILFTLAETMNVNPMTYFALLLISGNSGFMFPSSSSPAAMLYGNSEWISSKDIIKYSAVFILVVLVMFAIIGIPLASVIFS